MFLAIVMRSEVLSDKIEDGRLHGRKVATWNTRQLPKRLTPGWSNRLYVASHGKWRGHFPLSGDVLWNPDDETAPYALLFDPRRWTPIASLPAPSFRGWRYLEAPPDSPIAPAATEHGTEPPRRSNA
jgi:hypothetical protein